MWTASGGDPKRRKGSGELRGPKAPNVIIKLHFASAAKQNGGQRSNN